MKGRKNLTKILDVLQNVSDYSTNIFMPLTRPKSKVHSWQEKWGLGLTQNARTRRSVTRWESYPCVKANSAWNSKWTKKMTLSNEMNKLFNFSDQGKRRFCDVSWTKGHTFKQGDAAARIALWDRTDPSLHTMTASVISYEFHIASSTEHVFISNMLSNSLPFFCTTEHLRKFDSFDHVQNSSWTEKW